MKYSYLQWTLRAIMLLALHPRQIFISSLPYISTPSGHWRVTSYSCCSPQRFVFFLIPVPLRSDLTHAGFTTYFQFVHFTARQLCNQLFFSSHSPALHIQTTYTVSWYLTHNLRHFTSRQLILSTAAQLTFSPIHIQATSITIYSPNILRNLQRSGRHNRRLFTPRYVTKCTSNTVIESRYCRD